MTNPNPTQARRDAEASLLRHIREERNALALLAARGAAPDSFDVRTAADALAGYLCTAERMGVTEPDPTCVVCGEDLPAGSTDDVHAECARCPCGMIPASAVEHAWDTGAHRCYGGEPIERAPAAVDYTPAEVRLWRNVAILRSQAEVLGMIRTGQCPATVRTFSELHDYCDANVLGGLCDSNTPIADLSLPDHDADDDAASDAAMEFANAVQCAVDSWLRAGRPEGL